MRSCPRILAARSVRSICAVSKKLVRCLRSRVKQSTSTTTSAAPDTPCCRHWTRLVCTSCVCSARCDRLWRACAAPGSTGLAASRGGPTWRIANFKPCSKTEHHQFKSNSVPKFAGIAARRKPACQKIDRHQCVGSRFKDRIDGHDVELEKHDITKR